MDKNKILELAQEIINTAVNSGHLTKSGMAGSITKMHSLAIEIINLCKEEAYNEQ